MLAAAQETALGLLTDGVHLERAGAPVTDPLGTETSTSTTVWSGSALVQSEMTARQVLVVAGTGQQVNTTGFVAKLPVDAPVEVGDVLVVDSSLVAGMVGTRWRVLGVPRQGWQVVLRCPVDPVEV